MAKIRLGKPQVNPKSLANLKPINTHERASMLGKLGQKKQKEIRERKLLLHDDIADVVTAEMTVPDTLYSALKQHGIKCNKKERVDRIVLLRAMMKAIKDGNADQLLRLAEFAGFKADPHILVDQNTAAKVTVNVTGLDG